MKIFEMPEVEVLKFNVTDVITTSVDDEPDEVPVAPCF